MQVKINSKLGANLFKRALMKNRFRRFYLNCLSNKPTAKEVK